MATPAAVATPVPPLTPRQPGILRDGGATRHDAVDADRWIVRGTAKVAKDVAVGDLRLRGVVSVGGKLRARAVAGRGALEIAGPVEIGGELSLNGSLRAGASVHAGSLTIDGAVRSAGSISVDGPASLTGSVECPRLSAASVQVNGGAQIPGPIATTTFFARLRETSRFGPIAGRSVVVYGKVPTIVDKALFHESSVTVERIEAETVSLEGVEAAFVRAPQVALGRYCHVTEVEGTIVKQHPSSFVGPESRTPPPFGLRR